MDLPSITLNELTSSNAEVIGLNGRVVGHCGCSLPIVRHTDTGLCTLYSLSQGVAPQWIGQPELKEMERLKRVTLFTESMRRHLQNYAPRGKKLTVGWIGDSFIDLLDRPSIRSHSSEGQFPGYRMILLSKQEVEESMNKWSDQAREQFDNRLPAGARWMLEPTPRVFDHKSWNDLTILGSGGVQAAKDTNKRYWMYVRRGITLYFQKSAPPERAYQVFKVMVEPNYKGVTWDQFREEMQMLLDWALNVAMIARRTTHSNLVSHKREVHVDPDPSPKPHSSSHPQDTQTDKPEEESEQSD